MNAAPTHTAMPVRLLIAVCLIVCSTAASQAKCPITATTLIGSNAANKIRTSIESSSAEFRPAGIVAPNEMAYSASETLPLLRRADFLNPVWPGARIYLDAYYGSDLSTASPDYQIMPRDDTLLCSLSVGRAVFLSDERTHHYAVVYDINYQDRTITLLDPWASVSFLLPGNNLANIKAKVRSSKKGQALLELTFDEFQSVARGSVEEFNPEAALSVMEKLHPEYLKSEDYLFWRYSRLAGTNSWQRSLLPAIELAGRQDLAGMPKLDLLSHWAKDYIAAVQTRFAIPEPGRSAKPDEVAALRAAYFQRLPNYASKLPWIQKWLLLNRAQRSDDAQLYGETLRNFLAVTPKDIDFLIRYANFLIDQGQLDEALSNIERAKEEWQAEVTQTIELDGASPSERVKFLFSKDFGLQTLAVLHWRNIRIQFTEREISLRRAARSLAPHEAAMESMQSEYVISSLLLDFFPLVVKDAHLSHDHEALERYIKAVAKLPDDQRRIKIFARELYRFFNIDEDVSGLSPDTRATLRYSSTGLELCSLSQKYKPTHFSPLTNSFVRFCWPRASTLEGRWAEAQSKCAGSSLTFHLNDDGMLEVHSNSGATRTDWVTDEGHSTDNHNLVVTQLHTTQFVRGPYSFTSRADPQYTQAEPEEGFPVLLRSSQFEAGTYEIRDQVKFYLKVAEDQIAVRDAPSLSGKGIRLVRCPGAASTAKLLEADTNPPKDPSQLPGADDARTIVKRALDIGSESSRRRAYCGSFFAYSVDVNLPNGEFLTIKGPNGWVD